jgi:tetratricopeptide (TPR) repeat protein
MGMVRVSLWILVAAAAAFAQAEAEAERMVRVTPNDAQAWRQLGLARISANRLPAAAQALERACELERAPGDCCYFLARNYHAMADYEAARLAFDKALRKAPASMASQVHRAVGLNYAALGRDEEAERHLRKAVERNAGSVQDPRVDLGAFLFRQGRLEEARRVLDSAVRARPDSSRANLESGRVLLQLGELAEAVKRLEKSAQTNPPDWNAHLLLGRAYQRMGRDEDAARELKLGESGWRRSQPSN